MELLADLAFGLAFLVVTPLVIFAAMRLGGRIAAAKSLRAGPAHWTERARQAYPAWVFHGQGPVLLSLLFAVGAAPVAGLADSPLQDIFVDAVILVGLAASIIAPVENIRRIRGAPFTIADAFRNWAVLLLAFLPHLLVFGLMAAFLHDTLDMHSVAVLTVGVTIVTALNFGGYVWLLRRLLILQPAPDRLQQIVIRAGAQMGCQPKVFLLRWNCANALAFPFAKSIALTEPALAAFTDEELEAICVHEIEHLREPWPVKAGRLAGSYVWLPLFAGGPLVGTLGTGGWLVCLGASLLGLTLVRRMARAMEVRADAAGQAHQSNPGLYARALEKLYEINLMPAVLRQKNTVHPHLYDRLIAAGVTPPYARPEPPPRWPSLLGLAATLAVCLAYLVLWVVGRSLLFPS